ncbi:BLUF domain-containing protein (plasmid) [Polymorphobacter sp. PAMC 29334]|uniref:BLUF domain-containing protein n=1 Tax=Polymorphobacter sp. PAMC 29334 TaxID=2862331 RepID=UPI001C675B5F|nr:BLUF domain-containing protein [Polymorphobacter sp. PAMC 29334]QYE37067.1 BLUF domain-containing protein [Polymorphobacter sp. PAMC 29334]
MDMISLLYVSQSSIDDVNAEQAVINIVHASMIRNRKSEITGALMYTGARFIQILEGRNESVLELMDKIHRDVRHKNVRVISQRIVTSRLFEGWAMAYGGHSGFIGRHITTLLNTSSEIERTVTEKKIIGMMQSFLREI